MALYSAYADSELVLLLNKGDENAYREIYSRYRDQLAVYAINIVVTKEDALDILQDIFVNLWKIRGQLHITHSLKAYLYTGVRNGCLRFIDTRMKEKARMARYAGHSANTAENAADRYLEYKEFEKRIAAAIELLPEKMQAVFRLSREEELSHAEIGRQLDISEHTAKKHVQQALKLIRGRLGPFTGLFAGYFLF